jgi:hypothetical protein
MLGETPVQNYSSSRAYTITEEVVVVTVRRESPNFRFHALYDKVYRKDVLAFAYERCKANGGAAGVDNQTFENIEAYGKERWLDELAQELKSRTYQPLPVRRVYIPKPDGKQRPLGIPTIRDRVVQTSAMLVLEPIFEADLPKEQYAYRADRSALRTKSPPMDAPIKTYGGSTPALRNSIRKSSTVSSTVSSAGPLSLHA